MLPASEYSFNTKPIPLPEFDGYEVGHQLEATPARWGAYDRSKADVKGIMFYVKKDERILQRVKVNFPDVDLAITKYSKVQFQPPGNDPYARSVSYTPDEALVVSELFRIAGEYAQLLNEIVEPINAEYERQRREREEQRIIEAQLVREAREKHSQAMREWNEKVEEALQWHVGDVEWRLKLKSKNVALAIRHVTDVRGGVLYCTTIKGRSKRIYFTDIEQISEREGGTRYTPMDLPLKDYPVYKDPRFEGATT